MSRDATARLFVAVDPPESVCGELAAWARAALGGLRGFDDEQRYARRGAPARGGGRVRLLGAETMHLTLCFLGARPIGELETIATTIDACAADACELHVGAPLWLPPRNPRSLALSVHDRAGELTRLQTGVRDALAGAIDWRPERRRFRAHVTVARIARDGDRARRGLGGRRRTERGAGRDAVESPLAPTPQLAFTPRELVLYRSLLSPGGASYEAIAARTLGASATSSEPSAGPSSEPGAGAGPGAPGPRHASIDPSSAGVGEEPPSHSGAEPSSQA